MRLLPAIQQLFKKRKGGQEMETERITRFQKGQNIFTSNGISRIKVTKDGVIKCLEVPIASTGISDLIDAFRKDAPRPPAKNMKVTPNSDLGKQMKISRNEWVKMPDFTDPDFVEAKTKHDSDLGLAIALKGLAVEIADEQGNLVEDDAQKIEILRGMGLSGEQFSQMVEDITSLTKWTEEDETHFFA